MSETLTSFLHADELAAIDAIRSRLNVDVTGTFQFWESLVARIVEGELTDHCCPWDVEIPYGDDRIRIEVKHSIEFVCRFNTGPRPVFKFAKPKGDKSAKDVDAIVLIGVDGLGALCTWVVPPCVIGQCKSITLTSPRYRIKANSRSYAMDGCAVPPSQLLPEILRASRVRDIEHHKLTARATRRARLNNLELPL